MESEPIRRVHEARLTAKRQLGTDPRIPLPGRACGGLLRMWGGVATGRPACQRATRVLRCAPVLRMTRRPSLRSESSYGPCGPAWTGASRPSTTSRRTREEQSARGPDVRGSRGEAEPANAGVFLAGAASNWGHPYPHLFQETPKLRHPMPLFGNATLRLAGGRQLSSALVLPSREKLLTRAPYPRLSQTFYNAVDECDVAVCVGSSLRDEHVREAVRSAAQRAPTFIVNPQGETCEIEGAATIAQHASTFLISTLPNALLTSDPTGELLRASGKSRPAACGLLEAAGTLLDTRAPTDQRCQSVDELDRSAATLEPSFLESLLHDANPTVARYTLGLLPASPMVMQLLGHADKSRHVVDQDFRTDLSLLRRMVESTPRTNEVLGSSP